MKKFLVLLKKCLEGNLKGFSEEHITTPAKSDNSFAPKLSYFHNFNIAVKVEGYCWKQNKVSFTPVNVVNLAFVNELDPSTRDLNADFTSDCCLFGAVTQNKNTDVDKYCSFDVVLDSICAHFFSFAILNGVEIFIFIVDRSLSTHNDQRKKGNFVIVEWPTQGLNKTGVTAEAK